MVPKPLRFTAFSFIPSHNHLCFWIHPYFCLHQGSPVTCQLQDSSSLNSSPIINMFFCLLTPSTSPPVVSSPCPDKHTTRLYNFELPVRPDRDPILIPWTVHMACRNKRSHCCKTGRGIPKSFSIVLSWLHSNTEIWALRNSYSIITQRNQEHFLFYCLSPDPSFCSDSSLYMYPPL